MEQDITRNIEIRRFDRENLEWRKQAAAILAECFPHCYADCAEDETDKLLEGDKITLAAVSDGKLAGLAGANPQYGITGWELHPLAVAGAFRGRGIGTELVLALEKEIAAKGGVMLYLGTDDEFGKTTLSNTDLFEQTYFKIENIRNLDRHPYEFYQKAGFQIVGVLPDANGFGKPDIYMAKRIEAK